MVTKVTSETDGQTLLSNGYALLSSKPEQAKDLLGQARRLLEGDDAHKAAIYEARAYAYLGQYAEGRILIGQILKETLSVENCGHALLVRAVLDHDHPKRALASLKKIVMEGISLPLRARVHNQRARLQSEIKNLDGALIEYAGATALFESIGDSAGSAHALNNQASVYRKLKRYAEAHASVDRAMALLPKSDLFLSQFKDQKAQVFLAEEEFEKAEAWARAALAIVDGTDIHGSIVEAICTLCLSLVAQGNTVEAAGLFARAQSLAQSLDCVELQYVVTVARKKAAELFLQRIEVDLLQVTLKMCGGSYRQAAGKLGISHVGLMKALDRNSLKRKPKLPTSINSKPHK